MQREPHRAGDGKIVRTAFTQMDCAGFLAGLLMERFDWALAGLGIGVAVVLSFGFAAAGQPWALWLWRDVLALL